MPIEHCLYQGGFFIRQKVLLFAGTAAWILRFRDQMSGIRDQKRCRKCGVSSCAEKLPLTRHCGQSACGRQTRNPVFPLLTGEASLAPTRDAEGGVPYP
jgi:hypothetical protein